MTLELAKLVDSKTGSSAEILVSLGFNCFRFTAIRAGKPVEVLYAPDDFSSGQGRPSRGGIPLMYPFPGRIPGTTFTWQGKQYQLEPGDAFGNAIHGFVMWRPWRVLERTENKIVGQFHAWRDDPSLKDRWPADFRLTATYELNGNSLDAAYTVENPGNTSLPCGVGTHPYFRVPLGGEKGGTEKGDSEKADDCTVRLPVSARWELKDMLPTGQRLQLQNAAAFQSGQRYGDLKLDDAFTGLQFDGGWCTASIHDPSSGRTVTQRWDHAFRECVVYTPPHRQAICIEPLSCVPSCFDLTARGIDAGLRILQPGESFTARVEISVM